MCKQSGIYLDLHRSLFPRSSADPHVGGIFIQQSLHDHIQTPVSVAMKSKSIATCILKFYTTATCLDAIKSNLDGLSWPTFNILERTMIIVWNMKAGSSAENLT